MKSSSYTKNIFEILSFSCNNITANQASVWHCSPWVSIPRKCWYGFGISRVALLSASSSHVRGVARNFASGKSLCSKSEKETSWAVSARLWQPRTFLVSC